jgi:DedD protein
MKWAFWRSGVDESPAGRGRPRRTQAASDEGGDPGRIDPAMALRIRARRRLIGAAALLLAAVIIVPMVLDPAPRPVPDTVPIDIPSEKTPFTPRLPLPTVPDPASPAAPPSEAKAEPAKPAEGDTGKAATDGKAASPAKAERAADKPADKPSDKTADKAAPDADPAAQAAEAQRARDLLEGKTPTAPAKASNSGKYFVQAAAPRSEQAANELAVKLKKAGLPSFTERVQASDGTRWRVRVGPYSSRQDAERARTRLRELGTGADLIAP